jgi:hypothetical protein
MKPRGERMHVRRLGRLKRAVILNGSGAHFWVSSAAHSPE